MATIAWGSWQVEHIARRHGVSAQDFDTAWHDPDRQDIAALSHRRHGRYFVSIGSAAVGKPLKMAWRWQRASDIVWPITAFFPRVRRLRRS